MLMEDSCFLVNLCYHHIACFAFSSTVHFLVPSPSCTFSGTYKILSMYLSRPVRLQLLCPLLWLTLLLIMPLNLSMRA